MTDSIFLARRLSTLSDLIVEQGDQLLHDDGLDIPSRLFSPLLFIRDLQPTSASRLAKALETSHQLTAHKLKALAQLKLIRHEPDPRDGRKTLIRLTAKGAKTAAALARIADDAAPVFEELYAEIGIDMIAALDRLKTALERRSIPQRYRDRLAPLATKPDAAAGGPKSQRTE